MKIVALLLLLVSTVFGGEKGIERKVRNLLLLDKKLPITEAEYVVAKGYTNEDWVDYVYFSFKSTHSLEEIMPVSRALAESSISLLRFQDALDDFPLIPKLAKGITDRDRPTIVGCWYRAPHIYYGWCIGVKGSEGETVIMGLIESEGLPTNGTLPAKLFDRAGKAMSFEEFVGPRNRSADKSGEPQGGADQPASAPESKPESKENPNLESEPAPR